MDQTCLERPAAALHEQDLQQLLELGAPTGETAAPERTETDFAPASERIRAEVAEMLDRPLSEDLAAWVDVYAQVGQRNPYLWKWCARAVEVITLPCVAAEWRRDVCDAKTLGVMLDVMLDDLADRGGDDELLETLLALITHDHAPDFSEFPEESRRYGRFTADLWRELQRRARRYPRYDEFAALLRFDYLQLCNVMRYSHLLNRNLELLNVTEHDLYTPHNMHIMICSTFDLMCSPTFDRAELGKLREIMWNAQWMGRIGNVVTTWQRELGEGDFTSGLYARAVSCGDLTIEQLRTADRRNIEHTLLAGGHEAHFLDRWQRHRRELLSERTSLRSFNVRELVSGLERLICLHLGSRGSK